MILTEVNIAGKKTPVQRVNFSGGCYIEGSALQSSGSSEENEQTTMLMNANDGDKAQSVAISAGLGFSFSGGSPKIPVSSFAF